MESIQSLKVQKRATFKSLGQDDRNKFVYQGDIRKRFRSENLDYLIKNILLNDGPLSDNFQTIPIDFNLIPKTLIQETVDLVQQFFDFCGVSVAEEQIWTAVLDCAKNYELLLMIKSLPRVASSLNREKASKSHILELGPGSALLGVMFALDDRNMNFDYLLVEGLESHFFVQQLLLSFSSTLTKRFSYLSKGRSEKKLFGHERRIIHLKAWSLEWEFGEIDFVVANRFWDSISKDDVSFFFLNPLLLSATDNATMICRGGLDKNGIKDLYLYGYGTYHSENLIHLFGSKYENCFFFHYGQEITAVFSNEDISHQISGDFKSDLSEVVHERVQRFFGSMSEGKRVVWMDDDYPDLEVMNLTRVAEQTVINDSIASTPLLLGFQRLRITHLDEAITSILVLSFRQESVLAKIASLCSKKIKFEKISSGVAIGVFHD